MKSTMKKSTSFIGLCILCIGLLTQCTKKGDPIFDPNVANLRFTTFTVDTFLFKVYVNDVLLTDTLKAPSGLENSRVTFIDSMATLKIVNAATNNAFVDTMITLRPGSTTISIVQFITGQNPFLPPTPTEVPPAAGNYKVRFQYIQPSDPAATFYDSVQCVLRLSSVPFDTIVLAKYQTSSFYEAPIGSNFSMRIFDAATGLVIDNATNNLNSSSFTEFNTAILYSSNPTNFLLQRVY